MGVVKSVELWKLILKRIFIVTVMLAALQAGPPLRAADDPVLVTEPTSYNFGEILSGEVIKRQIVLRNLGKATLLLKKIEFTCGCTIPKIVLSSGREVVPELTETGTYVELEPDEWAEVKLEFQTIGRFGNVKHRMDIYTNDPEGQVRHIPILAKVNRAFVMDPPRVEFGLLDKKEQKSIDVRVKSEGVGDFKITGVDELPPFMNWSVKKIDEGGVPASLLTLTYKGGAKLGKHSFRLKVKVENEKVRDFGMYVDMRIYPSIIFRHEGKRIYDFLDIGFLERGKEKTVQIDVQNGDLDVPYLIKNVSSKSNCTPPVKVKCTPLSYGTKYRLLLTVSPKTDKRMIRGRILLESDHPDLPLAVIQFRGMYR